MALPLTPEAVKYLENISPRKRDSDGGECVGPTVAKIHNISDATLPVLKTLVEKYDTPLREYPDVWRDLLNMAMESFEVETVRYLLSFEPLPLRSCNVMRRALFHARTSMIDGGCANGKRMVKTASMRRPEPEAIAIIEMILAKYPDVLGTLDDLEKNYLATFRPLVFWDPVGACEHYRTVHFPVRRPPRMK